MAKKKIAEEVGGEADAVAEAIAGLKKKYGDGAIMTGGDVIDVEAVPTGCFALDEMLSCGGIPRGRILEIFGEASQGKSTLCTFIAGQVQKSGGKVALIDAECAFDKGFAETLGLDVDKLLLSQPDTLEEAADVVRALADTNAVDLCIVDSVAALTPRVELEGEEMLKDTMALQARLLSKALRILTGPISRSKMTVIFINQTRTNLAVTWGSKETTSGGKALRFYSSIRIKVSSGDKIEGTNKEQIGRTLVLSCVKNKCGTPYKVAKIDLYFAKGIDLVADTLDYAIGSGIITVTGHTYSYGDTKLGLGRAKAKENLEADKPLYEKIRKELYDRIKKNSA